MKKALITGITGQDGAYLAEFLLAKGYEVHGVKRRASLFNTDRIDHLFHDQHEEGLPFHLYYGDLTDPVSLIRVIEDTQPDEVYNLGAQSHVKVSFDQPFYTAQAVKIKDLAETIQRITGHTGKVEWDTSVPDGIPEKTMDVTRINAMGWRSKMTLEDGLRDSYEWFKKNVPEDEV